MAGSLRPTRPFRLFSLAVVLVSSGVFVLSWKYCPPALSLEVLLLAIASVLSESFRVLLPPYSFSLAYPLAMAALVFGGPTTGAVVAALSALSLDDFRERMPGSVMALNFGLLSLVTMAGGWAYLILGGRLLGDGNLGTSAPLGVADFPRILAPMAAAAVVCALGNDLLAGTAIGLRQGIPVREALASVAWLVPSQLALALVGYLIAQVLATNRLALLLFAAPFVVASQLYQRYAGLRDAYADTVRSLIGALEAKDPYTRGHSERVSAYATQLGGAMGLDGRTLERLEYAALLHDLGKLAVPRAVLTKPARLEPEEMGRIREHPARGAEMIHGIPHLRDLADAVRQHHERVDGTGYPHGIDGTGMLLTARVLAVADCYDAMTTTRAYRSAMSREQALTELVGGSGSQFDPEVVQCFIESGVGTENESHRGNLTVGADVASSSPEWGQ